MSEIKEGTYKIACTPEMFTKIFEKHSFTFKYDGYECYCGYRDGQFMSACPEEVQVDMGAIVHGIDRLGESMKELDDVKMCEVIYKYCKGRAKILRELERKTTCTITDVRPLDLETLSLEEQSMLEVMRDQADKGEAAGLDKFVVTKEMVDERIAQKKRQRSKKATENE